jgi:UDP-N-acetylglucosamine 2-epimerase (non-hydrolysing)
MWRNENPRLEDVLEQGPGNLPVASRMAADPGGLTFLQRRKPAMSRGNEKLVMHVVGARPNFMKLAPVYFGLDRLCAQSIVHTGQHYDRRMSGDFFDALGMPVPDYNLEVGSGSHGKQTGKIMLGLTDLLERCRPSTVVVYGDVNSTMAGALVASKMGIRCVHVEAGLRSGDRSMPEELNRLVTDQLCDLLFTHSREASENLRREGIAEDRIALVGNVMIDTLKRMLPAARNSSLEGMPGSFALVTLHRPSNVDDPAQLSAIAAFLSRLGDRLPVVFPIHPRTRARLADMDFAARPGKLILLEPLDYLRFVRLQQAATVVITDSGGVQEETTFLGTPCLTLRTTTERPVTVDVGTNTLVGDDPRALEPYLAQILEGTYKRGSIPELWDGNAGVRIGRMIAATLQ